MPISFKTEAITVLRPGSRIERGTPVPDWANATEHEVTGCRLQPASSERVLFTSTGQARDAAVSTLRLFAPASADLDVRDRVRYQGVVYDLAGPPRRWPSPTGALAHLEAELRRAEG
ncbi:hypothetical protein [Glycomyces sp. NPDC048151]|uniref:hypothetical protein n=1 Tax=Glycomyces sp. NPDC048151 TaxID=3364002 RepID=UPI00371DDFFC